MRHSCHRLLVHLLDPLLPQGLHHFLWWQLLALLFFQSSGAQVTDMQPHLLCWSCTPPPSWEIKAARALHFKSSMSCSLHSNWRVIDMIWDMDQLLLALWIQPQLVVSAL